MPKFSAPTILGVSRWWHGFDMFWPSNTSGTFQSWYCPAAILLKSKMESTEKEGFWRWFWLVCPMKTDVWVSPFSDPNYHCAGHVSHQYPVSYLHSGWFKQMRFLLLEFPILKHTHRDWTQCLIISISHSIHDSHPIPSPCCVVKHTHVYQHPTYSWSYF
jgi:hypothetical protein